MRVFVTGATGFIGSELVPELIAAGHQVLGLTRSEQSAEALRNAGAEALHGDLQNLDSLREGAAKSDGVIHLAFVHDFTNFHASVEYDQQAIKALGESLIGTNKPFVVTTVTGIAASVDGKPSTEDGPTTAFARSGAEAVVKDLVARGVNASVIRLPQVHDTRRQGLVSPLIRLAREKQVSAYLADGSQRWPAAHLSDVAHLYRLAFDKAEPGSVYHAVDEQGVSVKEIAEAIGRGLQVPVVSIPPAEAQAHFGWLAYFAGHNMPTSSEITRKKLNWKPTGPSLLADLEAMDHSQA